MKAQYAVNFSRAACITSLAASAIGDYVVVMTNLSDQYILHLTDAEETALVDAIVGENPLEDKVPLHWTWPDLEGTRLYA